MSALAVKILARRARLQNSGNILGVENEIYQEANALARYISCRYEKKFIATFAHGQRVRDLQYYIKLWQMTKDLQKPDCNAMSHILGVEIDMQNILWAYRLKKYYDVQGDAMYGYLVPINYRLTTDVISKIVHAKDAANIISITSDTPYGDILLDFENPEEKLNLAVCRLYVQHSRSSKMALLCGYLHTLGM